MADDVQTVQPTTAGKVVGGVNVASNLASTGLAAILILKSKKR